jgi:exosome complex component RRP4
MDKKIVIPGDLLTTEKKKLGQNTYIEKDSIYSSVIGLVSENPEYISVIALNGPYMPIVGDGILGVVKSEIVNGYFLDYNSPGEIYLPKSSLSRELKIGSVIFARIRNITESDSIELENVNILPQGYIFDTSPVKVPRLIGKNDSMLNLFKQYTESSIVIGKNGWVWYISKKPQLLEKAMNLVVNNSQKSNLTNTIKEYLEKNIK